MRLFIKVFACFADRPAFSGERPDEIKFSEVVMLPDRTMRSENMQCCWQEASYIRDFQQSKSNRGIREQNG
jgi:hypothetical protein